MTYSYTHIQLFNEYFSSVMFKQGFTIYPSLQRPHSKGYIALRYTGALVV